ncbi:alcohol dehydrogenase zinc-binding domain-containing protein [Nitritalea halalkaliphila LW7]|uniref:Alcohol dehydrogenase zinc-binding domain-containing protein n=1 Tax=Nitritalea halalkaliphila LW7 TaxID=1189621 RepID=I5CAP3_9BACT|nr:zinc-dependent alcohol dehydrogenase family protein [Nitritalea halalkaliphila]EIM78895.1 alcohol dehydrogenase zinc-binding domain-containing protein [Nitritalea halalkaliphila LW7]
MKQVSFKQLGLPEEVLFVEDVPKPEPAAGEALIRITARNINPSDIMFIRGMYGITPELPSSAGFEAVGRVEVSGGKIPVGTKVIFAATGTWREYIALSEQAIIPVPEELSDEVACQAFVNPMTAYGMIESLQMREGQTLLITAGASAFGKFAIQLAAAKGIEVLCTVRREEQKEALLALGAKKVYNTETEKLPKALLADYPKGIDVVFDAVGGTLGARALSCLRYGGTMLVFGLLSLENIPLNSGLLIFKNLTVKGFWLSSWIQALSTAEREKAFTAVIGQLMQGTLRSDVAARYTLDEIQEALKAYEAGGRTGKILLV